MLSTQCRNINLFSIKQITALHTQSCKLKITEDHAHIKMNLESCALLSFIVLKLFVFHFTILYTLLQEKKPAKKNLGIKFGELTQMTCSEL